MNQDNYLAHYGVLGMKWGVHRAKKNAQKATKARSEARRESAAAGQFKRMGNDRLSTAARNRSLSRANKQRAKAERYEARARQITQKHKNRAGEAAYNRVKNTSTLKLVGQSFIFGTYGTLKYQQAKARHAGTGQAIVDGLLYHTGDYLTGGILGIAEPRISAAARKQKKQS